MAAFGSLTVNAWRGVLQGVQKPVQIIHRPGVAGTGLLVGAARASITPVETDYYGTYAQVTTWRDTALGFVGTSQSVTDGFGTTWSDVAVIDLQFTIQRCFGLGGSNTHLIRATWHVAAEA